MILNLRQSGSCRACFLFKIEHVLHDKLEQTSNPVAPLALIVLPSAEKLGEKINRWIHYFRIGDHNAYRNDPTYEGYYEEDYRLPLVLPRFKDVFILVDITNYSITYKMNGFTNHMSPDDHFQDLKRVIAAINGKAHRINVIMPFLYEGRQHKRSGRESLDAAIMYKELCDLGIKNFITFDAHDPRIQNVNPLVDFNNFTSPYQFLKSLMRSVYFANVIGADTGMFYKRRDYSTIVNGKNPIVEHRFLGTDLDGKDAIIIDDMISSGGSILDTSRQLKENMHARRVFLCTTFGLFTDGLEVFDKAYEKGYFDKLVTTNLTYQPPELADRVWFEPADMSKFTAMIIDFINHDSSISNMSTSTDKIHGILEKINRNEQSEFEQMQFDQTEF